MIYNKEITFLIKVMNGGGAERVLSLLANAMVKKGYDVNLILTHQKIEDADLKDINNEIRVFSLEKDFVKRKAILLSTIILMIARIAGKISRIINRKESDSSTICKYYSRNYEKICCLKKWFRKHPKSIAIAFMYDSIFMTLLSTTSSNRIIISERGDPSQYIKSKTTETFIRTLFKKADCMVFQSPDVREWYLKKYNIDGAIIFNSVKGDLPERFTGERKKAIVNFCRISPEKNLHLLLDAYEKLQKDYPEYELFIYGNSNDLVSMEYENELRERIRASEYKEKIHLLEGRKDIHCIINNYAMYVSSSDHEGMSNSMLEAMAMGMPVICTDCPAGGARAIIKNEENGLLVPVRDVEKMYLAMKKIIEMSGLSNKLSKNAVCLRDTLAVDNIIEEWEKVIVG